MALRLLNKLLNLVYFFYMYDRKKCVKNEFFPEVSFDQDFLALLIIFCMQTSWHVTHLSFEQSK